MAINEYFRQPIKMQNKLLSFLCAFFLIALTLVILHSCANIASPSGGDYDVTPPVVKKTTPNFNALNVKTKTIVIEFDENIKIEKPMEKVIITPPQRNFPIIQAIGKKAIIKLEDELQPNTTYTIDFTDAIVDNNEGNPLENFSISFSTGDNLDTLAVSGKVLAAMNLEPEQGIYVGIHSNLHDSAFTKLPFERISRTDSRGNFTIRGMAPGKYKIYALNDLNRDYKYDNPQETIAFLDSVISPSTAPAVRQDTIFNKDDSTKIDTIKTVSYTQFLPDDVLLRSFLSDFQRQYLQKHERPEPYKLMLYFAAPTTLPTFTLLNPPIENDDWYIKETSRYNDTITLWITDSLIYKTDSIRMKINYVRTDSANRNFLYTDTIHFTYRPPKEKKSTSSKEKEKEEQIIRFLSLQHNIQSNHEIYQPIRLEFEQPIINFDSTHVKLFIEKDSVFEPVNYKIIKDTLNIRKYELRPRWEPEGKYRFLVDSAAFKSYYGLWNNKIDQNFSVKSLEQYGNLLIVMYGLPENKDVYVELLDKSDKPIRKTLVKKNEAKFQDLHPGTYYARLFIDENGDGEWTTGNYEEKRQPEEVYYYPRYYEIRAYTDHEESWDINEVPITQQKPLEITKNKPEEKKRRNPEADRTSTSSSRSTNPFLQNPF